ncbi:MAG TPA: ROK family protein [Acidimicrobiia bacterium]|nr:ROK family protein [Acidimicrobiia bacterium]
MTDRGYIGLDLGGTAVKAAFVHTAGGIVVGRTHTSDTPRTGSPQQLIEALVEAAHRVAGDDEAIAVGVGVPGQFSDATGRLRALPNVPGPWEGFPLRDLLATELGLPIHLVNDAQAFTLAETTLGAAVGRQTVLGMTLGTGIGGGICIAGRIHRGAHGTAGEIGHQVIVADGPPCGCGRHGCLESVAKSAVLAFLAGTPTAAEVFDAVEAGDPKAIEALKTVTGYLGMGLANVVAVLDPDVIVIGGGLAQAGDLLLDPLRAALHRNLSVTPPGSGTIVVGTIGTLAGAVGAALACIV